MPSSEMYALMFNLEVNGSFRRDLLSGFFQQLFFHAFTLMMSLYQACDVHCIITRQLPTRAVPLQYVILLLCVWCCWCLRLKFLLQDSLHPGTQVDISDLTDLSLQSQPRTSGDLLPPTTFVFTKRLCWRCCVSTTCNRVSTGFNPVPCPCLPIRLQETFSMLKGFHQLTGPCSLNRRVNGPHMICLGSATFCALSQHLPQLHDPLSDC
jgi:hypothetical protein